MKRYIYLVLMALVSLATYAQGFNPDNPPEPTPAYRVTLAADPAEAATLSGGGSYATGTKVSVKALANGPEWEFVDWRDDDDKVVSTKENFTYTVKTANVILTANFRKVPLSTVTIMANPESLFKSSSTTYKVGQTITVQCNNYSYYTFQNWTDATGAVLSTSRSFTYTVPDGNPVLTANFKYTPDSPTEPTETKPKHKVYFTANPAGAGSFSQSSGMQVSEGSSFSITAYAKESYAFVNWTDATGREVGTSETYRCDMGTEDVTLVANFRFQPGNPNEPGQSTAEHYTLYLPTVQMYQGETTMLPVYLENTGNVQDISFSLNLPENVTAQTGDISTTSRTSAYTPSATQNGTTLEVTLTGGSQISEHNGVMLYIPLNTETGCVDGEYPVTFASAAAVLADGMAKTVTTRDGMLEIVTLEEGELQAQFSVDRYLNRVQLTNMSSATARTFVWDFGDGTTSTEASPMHIYDTPGTYTVRLTAKAIVKTSTAEQVIVINAPSTWTASGDYTLNPGIEGIRNFRSIAEMVEIISKCRIDGNITVDYQGSRMTHSVYYDSELDQIGTIAAGLKGGDYTMTLKSIDEVRSINIGVKADEDYYRTVMGWLENVPTIDVNISLNYVGINTSALRADREQTVYSGETTEAVALTAMTTGGTDVSWASVVGAYCPISGRLYDGTGDIPPMTLTLEGKTAASLDYEIVYTLDGLVLYTMTYRYTGIAIDLDNVWLTDYTMPDSRVPVKEYKLHLVDYVASAGEKHYRIKLGKKAIDNRIPCGGITLTFADTNSDDGDAYAFEVGRSRRVTVTATPADCHFDPSMLVFSLPNTADAPTSWNLVSVSNASASGNKYSCDLTLNCPVDMSMLTVSYYGYTDPTLSSGRVQCVTPVKSGMAYTVPTGWSWIGVPTVNGPKATEFFEGKLIEMRSRTKYMVNDPYWGYFGNTETEISATTDNGHFRANLSDELTTCLYGSTSFNPAWTQIKPGFNWVANPMFFDFDLNDYPDFWQNLADQDMIKGKDGFGAYYDATTGQWDGWLETLEAGSAYMLNTSSQIKRIDFPCSNVNIPKLSAPRARSVRAVAADEPIWQYDGSAFQYNMAIAAVVEGLDQPEEFSIGTFVGDECRGEGNYKKGVWYIFAHGELGDIVTLKLMHVPTRTFYDFDCELEFCEAIGTPKNPLVLYAPDGVNDTSAIDTIQIDGTTIVNAKAIYDINGRDVTNANGHLLPGVYIARTATSTIKLVVK